MKIVYLAGPYRSKDGDWGVHQNIEAARKVARELWMMGFPTYCPHANTAFMGGPDEHQPLPDGSFAVDPSHGTSQIFLQGDMEFVRRSDFLVLLPGWERSSGAAVEKEKAEATGMPIYYWPKDRKTLQRLAKRLAKGKRF